MLRWAHRMNWITISCISLVSLRGHTWLHSKVLLGQAKRVFQMCMHEPVGTNSVKFYPSPKWHKWVHSWDLLFTWAETSVWACESISYSSRDLAKLTKVSISTRDLLLCLIIMKFFVSHQQNDRNHVSHLDQFFKIRFS